MASVAASAAGAGSGSSVGCGSAGSGSGRWVGGGGGRADHPGGTGEAGPTTTTTTGSQRGGRWLAAGIGSRIVVRTGRSGAVGRRMGRRRGGTHAFFIYSRFRFGTICMWCGICPMPLLQGVAITRGTAMTGMAEWSWNRTADGCDSPMAPWNTSQEKDTGNATPPPFFFFALLAWPKRMQRYPSCSCDQRSTGQISSG